MDLRFQALDERFEGPINNFVDIKYVAHNVLTLTPKDSFPAGVNEVRVAVMTAAEAAQQNRLTAAPADRIVIDVSAS
jgi:hypothetical protein